MQRLHLKNRPGKKVTETRWRFHTKTAFFHNGRVRFTLLRKKIFRQTQKRAARKIKFSQLSSYLFRSVLLRPGKHNEQREEYKRFDERQS